MKVDCGMVFNCHFGIDGRSSILSIRKHVINMKCANKAVLLGYATMYCTNVKSECCFLCPKPQENICTIIDIDIGERLAMIMKINKYAHENLNDFI